MSYWFTKRAYYLAARKLYIDYKNTLTYINNHIEPERYAESWIDMKLTKMRECDKTEVFKMFVEFLVFGVDNGRLIY